jgi:probable rRNA maturation factor
VSGLHGRLLLEVSFASRRPWVPSMRQFERWALAALPKARKARSLFIRVVGDAASRSLNRRYRGKDKPTNVLSFAGPEHSPEGEQLLGELVICAPLVAREARAQGKTTTAHWAHLTVHGVLHLLGHDHEQESQARKMESKEIQILDLLGFSDPYA